MRGASLLHFLFPLHPHGLVGKSKADYTDAERVVH